MSLAKSQLFLSVIRGHFQAILGPFQAISRRFRGSLVDCDDNCQQSGGNLDVFDPPLSFWGMASPEAGALWNWLTSATYTKANVSGTAFSAEYI